MHKEPTAEAQAAVSRGDFEVAAAAFGRAAARPLAERAQCLINLGRIHEARKNAAAASSLDMGLGIAWLRRGLCEGRLGLLSEAEVSLRKALELEPAEKRVEAELQDILRRKGEAAGTYDWGSVLGRFFETRGGEPLGFEPFLGPVRLGRTQAHGRGLFATADVKRGALLLCAGALMVSRNSEMATDVAAIVGRNAAARQAVLTLSRGSPESEQRLPAQSLEELTAPSNWALSADGPVHAESPVEVSDIRQVLRFNQFALTTVDPTVAPVALGNDSNRSGLWLLPAYVNHSCRPNVQRVVLHDRLVLRAARDLREGEELFDSYIEVLQPLAKRRSALQAKGFRCRCERCMLEEAALDDAEVHDLITSIAEADRLQPQVAPSAPGEQNIGVRRAEELVERSVAKYLSSLGLPDISAPVLKAVDAAEPGLVAKATLQGASLRARTDMQLTLMGSLVPVWRQRALTLQANAGARSQQVAACQRLLDIMDVVLPCSELRALTSSQCLFLRLLLCRYNLSSCRVELLASIKAHDEAYGGGVDVWCLWNKGMFRGEVLDAAKREWLQEQKKVFSSAAPISQAIVTAAAECVEAPSVANAAVDAYSVKDLGDWLVVRTPLPKGAASLAELDLQVSSKELRLHGPAVGDGDALQHTQHLLVVVPLPREVDPALGEPARWSRKEQMLTLRLRPVSGRPTSS